MLDFNALLTNNYSAHEHKLATIKHVTLTQQRAAQGKTGNISFARCLSGARNLMSYEADYN